MTIYIYRLSRHRIILSIETPQTVPTANKFNNFSWSYFSLFLSFHKYRLSYVLVTCLITFRDRNRLSNCSKWVSNTRYWTMILARRVFVDLYKGSVDNRLSDNSRWIDLGTLAPIIDPFLNNILPHKTHKFWRQRDFLFFRFNHNFTLP